LRQSQFARDRDDAMQLGIELLDALEVDVGETLGGELALLEPARELAEGCESNVSVVCREWTGSCCCEQIDLIRSDLQPRWAGFHREGAESKATLRGRCAAHRVPPSSCANCLQPVRSVSVNST
jgi:hypothetical protein